MAFGLRTALLRKAEVETARLVEFEFRLRAQTMRLLARTWDGSGCAKRAHGSRG